MRNGIRLPAQHHGRQRGQANRRVPAPIHTAEPGVLRTYDAVKRDGGVPGFRRAVIVAHQTGHRGLRSFLAHAASADAVGNGDDRAHARLRRPGQHGGAKIFVDVFATRLRCKTNVNVKCHALRLARVCQKLVLMAQQAKTIMFQIRLKAAALSPTAFACSARTAPSGAQTRRANIRWTWRSALCPKAG